jgi:hypothetical protein
MRLPLVFLLLSCLSVLPLRAQKHFAKTAPETLRQWQAKYPEAKILCLDYVESYDFQPGEQPVARQFNQEQIVNLSPGLRYHHSAFYDEFSRIEKLQALRRNGNPLKSNVFTRDYETEGIFYDDSKLQWIEVPITEPGAQVDLRLEKHFLDLRYLTTVFFHERYPVQQKTIEFLIPDWLDLELKEVNFEGFAFEKQETSRPEGRLISYRLQDIPPVVSASNSPGPSHFLPHLVVLVKSHTWQGQEIPLFRDVDDLYAWYASLVKELNPDLAQLRPLVESITRGLEEPRARAEAIYYWVQEHIRYIAYEDGLAGFQPEEAHSVLAKQYGDCKGMANLTCEMLKLAGLDARPTWIGTRRLAYDYSIPSLVVDNHMITCLFLGEERIFLDPTEKYIRFGEYAHRIQDRPVLIYDGKNFILDQVPSYAAQHNTLAREVDLGLSGEQLTGKGRLTFNGESKNQLLGFVESLRSEDVEEAIKGFIKQGDRNLNIETANYTDFQTSQDHLVVNYDFQAEGRVSSYGGEYYLDLNLEQPFARMEIEEDRWFDYVFSAKLHRIITLRFKVPENMDVSFLPEPFLEEHPRFRFKLSYQKQGDIVEYHQEFTLPDGLLKVEDFPRWNEAVGRLGEFYQQQIVLQKHN